VCSCSQVESLELFSLSIAKCIVFCLYFAVAKSPMFSHISSTVLGLQTVRAFRAEETFTNEFDGHQDLHTSAAYLFFTTSRWFAVRLECLCAIFITIVVFLSVVSAQRELFWSWHI